MLLSHRFRLFLFLLFTVSSCNWNEDTETSIEDLGSGGSGTFTVSVSPGDGTGQPLYFWGTGGGTDPTDTAWQILVHREDAVAPEDQTVEDSIWGVLTESSTSVLQSDIPSPVTHGITPTQAFVVSSDEPELSTGVDYRVTVYRGSTSTPDENWRVFRIKETTQ
jgi:hypothetical protein